MRQDYKHSRERERGAKRKMLELKSKLPPSIAFCKFSSKKILQSFSSFFDKLCLRSFSTYEIYPPLGKLIEISMSLHLVKRLDTNDPNGSTAAPV